MKDTIFIVLKKLKQMCLVNFYMFGGLTFTMLWIAGDSTYFVYKQNTWVFLVILTIFSVFLVMYYEVEVIITHQKIFK